MFNMLKRQREHKEALVGQLLRTAAHFMPGSRPMAASSEDSPRQCGLFCLFVLCALHPFFLIYLFFPVVSKKTMLDFCNRNLVPI